MLIYNPYSSWWVNSKNEALEMGEISKGKNLKKKKRQR